MFLSDSNAGKGTLELHPRNSVTFIAYLQESCKESLLALRNCNFHGYGNGSE